MNYFKRLDQAIKDHYGPYNGKVVTISCALSVLFLGVNFISSIYYFIREIVLGNYIPLIFLVLFVVSFMTFYLGTKYNEAKEEIESGNSENWDDLDIDHNS